MELIPIIKYALTMISAIAFVVVVFSYIMYKIKNADKAEVYDNSNQIITTFDNSEQKKYPVRPTLQPIRVQKEPSFVHERNFNQNRIVAKKPVQRFMVLNSNPEPDRMEAYTTPKVSTGLFENQYGRQSFNIYSNYSANSTEPLHKFGI